MDGKSAGSGPDCGWRKGDIPIAVQGGTGRDSERERAALHRALREVTGGGDGCDLNGRIARIAKRGIERRRSTDGQGGKSERVGVQGESSGWW